MSLKRIKMLNKLKYELSLYPSKLQYKRLY